MRRWTIGAISLLAVLLAGPAHVLLTRDDMGKAWHQASNESGSLAPKPEELEQAVVQVYAARAWGWRGAVAVHTWISVKPEGADAYTVYQVIGWRKHHARPVLSIREDVPDRMWYGSGPAILADLRGDGVDDVIGKIHRAARDYPYPDEYRVWPGPNSNTFTAWVGRNVPELKLDLPPTAIGKDWLGAGRFLAKVPSGTGYQLSVWGVLGIAVGMEEGIEINLGGAHFGIDPLGLALRLPGWGIVGTGEKT